MARDALVSSGKFSQRESCFFCLSCRVSRRCYDLIIQPHPASIYSDTTTVEASVFTDLSF